MLAMLFLEFSNKRIVCSSPVPYKNRPAETCGICEPYMAITVESQKRSQAGLGMQNSKSDPGRRKTNEKLFRAGMKNGQHFCYKIDSGFHRSYDTEILEIVTTSITP